MSFWAQELKYVHICLYEYDALHKKVASMYKCRVLCIAILHVCKACKPKTKGAVEPIFLKASILSSHKHNKTF